jgi:hypothetical protein
VCFGVPTPDRQAVKKHPRAARYYTLRHDVAQGFTAQRDDDEHGEASEALGILGDNFFNINSFCPPYGFEKTAHY